MSKEELERASVQGQSSSVPPRPTSDAPAVLPSTPPSTDEIDTDWGADDSTDWSEDDASEVTRVMLQPMRLAPTPAAAIASEAPTSPTASAMPPELAGELPTSPIASERPPELSAPEAEAEAEPEPKRDGGPRAMRARSQTLIGLPAPKPPAPLAADFTPLPEDKRESTPPPMPSAAFSPAPARAPSAPPPAPIAAPSRPPPPVAAPSTPPPPIAAPSRPPPPMAAPSTPPVATSSAPPPRSSLPAPRVVSTPPAAVAEPANQSGFGRWLLLLAAGLILVSVLGYRVLRKNRAALAEAEVAASPPEPATATQAATIADPPPLAPATSAAEPAPAASAAEPAPAVSAAEPTPSPAASAAVEAASAANIRRVTVKSQPPKARFFHFGKPVGTAPFVLELKPGERHAYEAGLPGYGTRKVVIDGTKPEITVGLTREKH